MPSNIEQMERDFFSGRNPLAYIPLCQALRKQKNVLRALDLCQRGLAGDPHSIAGRTLHARLLADLGHYEDALKEIRHAEAQDPEALGLLTEKVRCLVKLHRMDEARPIMETLNRRNPMGADVQHLNSVVIKEEKDARNSMASVPVQRVSRIFRHSPRDLLDSVRENMRGAVPIQSCAVIPTGAGEPAVEGNTLHVEAAYAFYKGASTAFRDLEAGSMRVGLIETNEVQLIVLVREKILVSLSFEPTPSFGKVFHRFVNVVGQLLPGALPT